MSKMRKATILVIAAVLGACFLGLAIVGAATVHYQPAVVAAPGYDMLWPTRPGLWAGAVKGVQTWMEVRPCDYEVLGWSTDGALFYEEACQDTPAQVWAYDAGRSGRPYQVEAAPVGLVQEIVPRRSILERVRVPFVRPADEEPNVRSLQVRLDGLASPDGRWVALVVRHVYGPEDVIVVSN
jgi:hypothetical protein